MEFLHRKNYLITLVGLLLCSVQVWGGSCWFDVNSERRTTAAPESLLSGNITRQECCDLAPSGEKYYSSNELPAHSNFQDTLRWKFIQPHTVIMACQDGCQTFSKRCGESQLCKVTGKGIPKCVCNPHCSQHKLSYRGEVCGKDGKTYSHHCQLLRQNCRRNKHIEIEYYGKCKAYGCDGVKCSGEGNYCTTDQYNQPKCVPDSMAPLCGRLPESLICATNGETYKNLCFMTSENIRTGSNNLLSYHGECKPDNADMGCQSDDKCKSCLYRNSTQSYVCQLHTPSCNNPKNPMDQVCGNDGQTYPSECLLRLHRFQAGLHITVKHAGACHASEADIKAALAHLRSNGAGDDDSLRQRIGSSRLGTRRRRRRH